MKCVSYIAPDGASSRPMLATCPLANVTLFWIASHVAPLFGVVTEPHASTAKSYPYWTVGVAMSLSLVWYAIPASFTPEVMATSVVTFPVWDRRGGSGCSCSRTRRRRAGGCSAG